MNPVYESVKWLVEESSDVKIDWNRIKETAREIENHSFDYPTWDFRCLPGATDAGTLEFFFLINCLNFKFWHTDSCERFSAMVDGERYYGAFAMFALLTKWYNENPSLVTGRFLKELDTAQALPRLTGETGSIPMLDERIRIMNEVGHVLFEKYGDFSNLVSSSDYRCFNHGEGIVERLVRDFPSFRDEYLVGGKKLIFNKRAQLAPAMVFAKFRGTDMAPIRDMDKLTAFADYQVPKGLKMYGIMKYSDRLERMIRERSLLPHGSMEEIEIRVNTIFAIEKLLKEINRDRSGPERINAVQMDYHLWKKARDNKEQYHLTETTAY